MIKYEFITGRKISVGLVGCGRISGKHIEAFNKHAQDLSLAAVCDVDPTALAAAEKTTGAKGYSSLTEMLDRADIDAVVLATPSGLHSAQTIAAARAGKHVITEKPMATRWSDGIAMVKACDEAGVRLFVVKQNRSNSTLQLLKRAVDLKRFGRIYMVTINVIWSRPQEYYDSAKWRGTWEFDGGALMNQASHYVDLVDWLVGPVESVHAYVATLARNIQVEDTAAVSVRWRSGALGTINVTMLAFPRNYEGSITIVGEKGLVRVGGVAVNEIQTWEFADQHPDDAKVRAANYETTSVYGFGHPLYYENVIATLRGKADAETDGREGLHSLEVLIASYLSARDGRRVALPLDF
jgi:UDP-N-acetyl-2-amino-2-deoxyglucuronate dehydrogenase